MVALVAAWLFAATPDLSTDLSLRSETRTNHLLTEGPGGGAVSRLSTEVTPLGALAVEARDWRLRLTYAPRLWIPDLEQAHVDVDNQVDLRGEGNPLPQWNLAVGGTATRGYIDPLANLWTSIGPPVPAGAPLNSEQPIPYWSYRGEVGSVYHLNAVSSFSANASAGWSTGIGLAGLAVPPQRSFAGSLGYRLNLDARNEVGLRLAGEAVRTTFASSSGPQASTTPTTPTTPTTQTPSIIDSGDFGLTANWRRQLNPYFAGTAAAGADYLRQTSTYSPGAMSVTPVGSVGAEWRSDGDRPGVTLRADLGYAPLIDRITGQVRKAVIASTRCEWPVSLNTSVTAGLDSSAQVQTVDPAWLSAEFRVSRRLNDVLNVALGARALRQTVTKSLIQAGAGGSFTNTAILPNYSEESIFLAIEWLAQKNSRGPPPLGPR